MTDSIFSTLSGPELNWDNPEHVAEWLESLPPSNIPPTKSAINVRYRHGERLITVCVTRAAQIAIAGTDDLSTIKVINHHEAEIDRQITAMIERNAEPITGWVLDASNLI